MGAKISRIQDDKNGRISQGFKKPRAERRLLARADEDEPVVAMPEVVGIAIVRAEPQRRAKASHAEHAPVAARDSNPLHGDNDPLAVGLVLILQAQIRTNFRRAELEAALLGRLADLAVFGSVREAELSHRDLDQVQLRLLRSYDELGFAENVAGPVADFEPAILERLAEIVRRPELWQADFDRPPDRELLAAGRDLRSPVAEFHCDLVAGQNPAGVLLAHLVEKRLDLAKSPITVLHLAHPFFGCLPKKYLYPRQGDRYHSSHSQKMPNISASFGYNCFRKYFVCKSAIFLYNI